MRRVALTGYSPFLLFKFNPYRKMKKANKKIFVHLSKMRTEIGTIPVLGNSQPVNRETKVFHAEKEGSSVFFIVREKDAQKLKQIGYNIQSVLVMPKHYPVALNWVTGTELETRVMY